jgi:hypothetical protein
MRLSYTIALFLTAFFMLEVNAQFVQIDGKDPVFHIKFDALVADDTRLDNAGTEHYQFTNNQGVLTNDTVEGHSWGGGLFSGFTFLDQPIVANTLPSMFWNSYLSYPNRPQGIAAYSRSNGGYMGPMGSSARTISFFMHATDSARADTANGAWDINYLYGCGIPGVAGERLYWYYHPDVDKFNIWFGGDANSATAEGAINKNEWVHLALVIPEGGARADIKFYINGVETFFDEENGDLGLVLNTTPEADWDGVRVGALSNMWMADYRIYDQVLTSSEVSQLAGNGTSTNMMEKQDFNIYPIPNNGNFTVEFENGEEREVSINNILGKTVHTQVVKGISTFDLSHLTPGTYFIYVKDVNSNYTVRKMIIN